MPDVFNNSLQIPASNETPRRRYRPWSRGRVWTAFMFGMHAAFFMTFFFFPLFSLLGLAFGIPAVVLTGIEIREFPEAATCGPVRWARITGLIGIIAGSIALFLFAFIAVSAL